MAAAACPECTEEECKRQALERMKAAQDAEKTAGRTSLKAMLAQKDMIWRVQFDRAVEEMDKKFCVTSECFDSLFEEVTKKFRLEFGDVCEEIQKGVIECYRKNKKSPLVCQRTVQDYTDCVNETSRSTVEKAAKDDEKKKAEKKH